MGKGWFNTFLLICGLLLSAHSQASIVIADKTLHLKDGVITYPAFYDETGREVFFRGWNTSGSVKLVETGFKPFHTAADAATSFRLMRQYAGSNMVRFTLAWEGTHPQVDVLDTDYLDALAEQIRAAINERIYVYLDYHVDLYSRHLFTENMPHTGNGAPKWIIDGGDYPPSGCGIICFAWSQNNVTNFAVRRGYQYFFDNAPVGTDKGTRYVQDEFLWQLEHALDYLKAKFTPDEFAYITGVQPFNEPIYGKGHKDQADFFDNERLWPFYEKVRAIMDNTGWQNQWVYAEPMVFWDTNAGFFTPPTGGGYLKELPGPGYVFAPHFYDAARMGVSNLNRVENADYFENLDRIREEADFLNMPMMLGEFGMWLGNQDGGHQDYVRMVKGVYQALSASDHQRPQKDRHLDFATRPIAGTQWHWDIYKDQHNELMNGNPNKVVTEGDGWNDEDFSAIKGNELTVDQHIIQQAFPRRLQGNLVSFYYNNLPTDGAGQTPQWAAIPFDDKQLFKHNEFLWVVWQGRHSDSPTEIFLPRHFDLENSLLISDEEVRFGINEATDNSWTGSDNGITRGGHVLSMDASESGLRQFHFALIVQGATLDPETAGALQQKLKDQVAQEENPVYLTGRMVSNEYPLETPPQPPVTIIDVDNYQFFIFRLLSFSWDAPGPVTILKNGQPEKTGKASGRTFFWSRVGNNDQFQVCLQENTDSCSKSLLFH